jgi:hypothetical protein
VKHHKVTGFYSKDEFQNSNAKYSKLIRVTSEITKKGSEVKLDSVDFKDTFFTKENRSYYITAIVLAEYLIQQLGKKILIEEKNTLPESIIEFEGDNETLIFLNFSKIFTFKKLIADINFLHHNYTKYDHNLIVVIGKLKGLNRVKNILIKKYLKRIALYSSIVITQDYDFYTEAKSNSFKNIIFSTDTAESAYLARKYSSQGDFILLNSTEDELLNLIRSER